MGEVVGGVSMLYGRVITCVCKSMKPVSVFAAILLALSRAFIEQKRSLQHKKSKLNVYLRFHCKFHKPKKSPFVNSAVLSLVSL